MTTIVSTDIHQDRAPMDAKTTLRQITTGGLMTVGASEITLYTDAVTMKARIHPRRANGTRASAARVMDIMITLGHDDLYRVSVRYFDRRSFETVTHWEGEGIYCDDLARLFLALDSGTEAR